MNGGGREHPIYVKNLFIVSELDAYVIQEH
jgi:hypothetical protein